jgi:hypothetical protein
MCGCLLLLLCIAFSGYSDCFYSLIRIDTLRSDSFLVKELSFRDSSVIAANVICKSAFVGGLLNRLDSSTIVFVGRIDSVQRVCFQDGTMWRYRDSVRIKADTVIKGQCPLVFKGFDVDPNFRCNGPCTSTGTICAQIMGDDYKMYSTITGKEFIMFAKTLDNLRTTSVSPSWCRGDYGNFIVHDTICSDYPNHYPVVKIALRDFIVLLQNRTSHVYRGQPVDRRNVSAFPKNSLLPGKRGMCDIMGRSVNSPGRGSNKANAPAGVYVVPHVIGLEKVLIGIQ